MGEQHQGASGVTRPVAHTDLANRHLGLFSEPGLRELQHQVDQFIGRLVEESHRVSLQGSADTISADHVKTGCQRLTTSRRRSRYIRLAGVMGGILLGGGLQQAMTMVSSDQTRSGLALVLFLVVIGTFLVALDAIGE
jgi:hypothetical protein